MATTDSPQLTQCHCLA